MNSNLAIMVAKYIGHTGLYQEKDKGDSWYDVNGLMFNSTEDIIEYVRELHIKSIKGVPSHWPPQELENLSDCKCPDRLCMSKKGVRCHYE